MKSRHLLMAAATSLFFLAAPVFSHEAPNIDHTHAFQQTGYGKYRQGHYVNGPQGSIVIWSARPHTGYQAGSTVKFARPVPISRAPGTPKATTQKQANPAIEYGKR